MKAVLQLPEDQTFFASDGHYRLIYGDWDYDAEKNFHKSETKFPGVVIAVPYNDRQIFTTVPEGKDPQEMFSDPVNKLID